MKTHRILKVSRRVGDPSSKYAYNPEQFDIDMQNNIARYEKRKAEITLMFDFSKLDDMEYRRMVYYSLAEK